MPSWQRLVAGARPTGSWDDIGVQDAPEHIPPVPAGSPPLPAALLRHRPGDGTAHFDLLLAVRRPAGDDDACAATWRVAAAPDGAVAPDFRGGPARLPAERIHDHRALYLRLDEPRTLDRGRGDVLPAARGTWTPAPEGGATITWTDGARGTVRFVRRADGGLDLHHVPAPQTGAPR